MKIFVVPFAFAAFLAILTGCGSRDSANRDEHPTTPGTAAGHAAYVIEKDAKKVAKEAAKDIKTFGHDAHEGFQDAKQKDLERKKAKEAEGAGK
jgi:hypothetical protein